MSEAVGHPFQKEVLIAQKLARKAGEMAKAIQFSASFSLKADGAGPVSEADFRADEIIREGLSLEFPLDILITEETSESTDLLPKAHRIWLVDPIDGTSDFVLGGPNYSVMIGLLVDGTPALGVIFEPETDTMWTGVNWQDESLEHSFAELSRPGEEHKRLILEDISVQSPIVAVSKSHPSELADQIVERLNPSQVIKMGSIGLKLGLISEGKADLYVAATRRIKAWDTCAPFALLKAAGGFAYTLRGEPVVYGPTLTHTTPFYAVSRRFAPKMLKRLASSDFDFIKDF